MARNSFRGAARSLISPTYDYAFSDNITWVKGRHTVKAGALLVRNGKDQNGRTDYAGNVIDELTLVYNKNRQAGITKELSEIVGGAAAV